MDFIGTHGQNFLTIADTGYLHLKGRGLNLLQGINDDDTSASSNGSGKSSIPDLVCWVLFDATARGESGDDIVNDKVKKDCVGYVDLLDGATRYRVTRYRKHKTGKNEVHVNIINPDGTNVLNEKGEPLTLTKGTVKETQLEINNLLGCTYEVFKASIYAGQEDMPDIPKMKDRQLKMLIEEAAGVQRLEKAYELASKKALVSERVVETNEVEIERSQAAIKSTNVDMETAKLRHAEWEEQRKKRIEGFLAAVETSKASARVQLDALKAFDEPAIAAKLEKLKTTIAGSDDVRRAADEYASTLAGAERALAVEESSLARLAAEAQRIRHRFDNAHAELEKPCSECGKPHTAEELDHLKGVIRAQLVAKVGEHSVQQAKVVALKADVEKHRVELARLVALVPDVSSLATEASQLQTQLQQITAMKHNARAKVTEAQTHVQSAESARAQENPQDAHIAACLRRIDELNEKIKTLEAGLVEQRRTAMVDRAVAQVYSPAGVRAHILDGVTPFLNERTAEYLGTLSDGNISAVWSTLSRTAKGELREKFVIDVSHAKGGKSFGLISGGEKRKVRLACMLALQDLVASRATKPLNLWMGDEIDDALDKPGIERLMVILEKKAREKGTVVVISHNELRDWIDDVTVVRKHGGVSSVEGALCAGYTT